MAGSPSGQYISFNENVQRRHIFNKFWRQIAALITGGQQAQGELPALIQKLKQGGNQGTSWRPYGLLPTRLRPTAQKT